MRLTKSDDSAPLHRRSEEQAATNTTIVMNPLIILVILTLFAAAPPAQAFGLQSAKRGGKPSASSSPLLDDALESYPYVIKDDADRSALSGNFNELARLYSDEGALAMVRIQPRALKFKRENFQLCLDSWEEQFGLEKAQGMVMRNPGLLGVKPDATKNAEASFFASYIIAATRPSPITLAVAVLLIIYFGGNAEFWQGGGFYNGELVEGR